MYLSEEAALETAKGAVRLIVLMRIAADPVARAWSGVGDLWIDEDAIETESGGAAYKGTGQIAAMPAFEALINGQMGRLEITVSGVPAAVMEMVDAAIADVEGKTINWGIAFLDSDYQLVAPPLWMVEGVLDELTTTREPGSRTVGLSAAHGAVDRRRPALAYLTDADQKRRHAGDLCCDRMALYDTGRTLTWPQWK